MFDLIKAQSVLRCAQVVLQEVWLCSCVTLFNVNRDVIHLLPQSHYIALCYVCIELVCPCRRGTSWHFDMKKKLICWNICYHNETADLGGSVQIQCALPLRGVVSPRLLDRWTGMTSCHGSYQESSTDDTVVWTVGRVGGVKCCPLCWAIVMWRANTESNPGVYCQYRYNTNTLPNAANSHTLSLCTWTVPASAKGLSDWSRFRPGCTFPHFSSLFLFLFIFLIVI